MANPSTSEANSDARSRGTGGPQKDVSLGPACLIVAIFGAVALSVGMVVLAFMMTGSQGRRAAYSVREQLIPWVEQSSLSQPDRVQIVARLTDLSSAMEREELTSRQFSRLALRLMDSPVLQWGVVEQLNQQAQKSEMTAPEKEEFRLACDRWLRAASEGKLSVQDMEFAVQNVATKEQRSSRLSVREDVNEERLREFHRRITAISDKNEIAKEPFDKSVSQVFLSQIDDAMAKTD